MIDVDMIPYEVVHADCGKVAAYLRRMPERRDLVRSADFLLLSGDRPQPFTPCLCGSCGEPFWPQHDNIRPRVTECRA